MTDIINLVIKLSNNFSTIITIDTLIKYDELYWGGNGIGDRWANKKFNYSVIYSNNKIKTYSENDNEQIENNIYLKNNNKKGINGIFVHSLRTNIQKRPININIYKEIIKNNCVICGSSTNIICDHKNDLYNDLRVLNIKSQIKEDFQPLCNHCNLQKRQIAKNEKINNKIYSAKNINRYKQYPFEFPWEKKAYDINNIYCKIDSYWYDPIEFENKIYLYLRYKLPIINEIKKKIKLIS